MTNIENTATYVVIGAGLAGAATAWRLATRGHNVVVVERFSPANHAGSSHGSARIFRYAYPEAFYTELVKESKAGWDELSQLAGTGLITPTGSIDYGQARDPRNLARVLSGAGVHHELLGADESKLRWPQFDFDSDVLWHPDAGVIDAELAVTTMITAAINHGATMLNDWPVESILSTPTGYRLTSSTGDVLDATHIVVAAGGWLPDLVGGLPLPADFLSLMPVFEVRQEQAYHFPYRGPDGLALKIGARPDTVWPAFIHKTEDMQVYGLPGGRDADFRGQKVAEYNGGPIMHSASQQDGTVDAANRERVIDYVRRHLPGLVPVPYAETTCIFTTTPSEDFIIDRSENITIVSPCSGHGAKFAPLIGQLAADLATGVAPPRERFTVKAASARA